MAGKRFSRAHVARIQQIADHAYAMGAKAPGIEGVKADVSLSDQTTAVHRALSAMVQMQDSTYPYVEDIYADYLIVCLGDAYYRADYTTDDAGAVTLAARDAWVQVEEVWQPVQAITKAGALAFADDATAIIASVKALGDRTLELRVAWGWDNHKEQFHPQQTDFDIEHFPTPPVAYYHGYTKGGKPARKPVYIGKTIKRENRADGHYLIAQLNTKPEADQVWAAALKGEAVVSPATAGHLRRKESDGTLTYWPIVEISAWDYAPDRKQAHPQSRAFPVLKALYQEAGITLPSFYLSKTTPPEAAGDAASAGAADISPEQAELLIVTGVADALLALRKRTL